MTFNIKHFAYIIASIWTAIVIISAIWNFYSTNKHSYEMALIEAKNSFKKDVAYRRWNAMMGSVYVPVTKDNMPNPYLNVPERDVITKDGRRLTMINPAYMTRLVHELMQTESGVKGHITSKDPIRPENKPDAWETNALTLFEKGLKELSSIEKVNGIEYMRYMAPLKTEKPCLICHAFQGYKEGDIRGGISVSVPMDAYKSIVKKDILWRSLTHLMMWLIGLGVIAIGSNWIVRSENEQKMMSRKLEESEKRYRSIFDNAIEGIFQSSPQGYFINVNQSMAHIHGYSSPEEMIAAIKNIGTQLYVNPEDRVRLMDILEEKGRVENFEAKVFKKDGTVIWTSISSRIKKDEAGNAVYFEGIVQDITAHKKDEEKLRRYTDEIFDLYNNAPCGYHSIGPDGTFMNINNTELIWLGYDRDEIIGKMKFSDLLTPDSIDKFKVNFPILQQQGYINDLEYTLIRKDGTVFPILLNSTVVRDSEGNFVMNRSTMFDITRLKQAEDELHHLNETLEQRVAARTEDMKQARRVALSMMQDAEKERERVREALEKLNESEKSLRQADKEQAAILESLTLGVAFIRDNIILRGNNKLGELFGRPLEEMVGQSTRIWYINEEEYLGTSASTYEDLKHHNIHRREQQLIRKDGSLFWCLFNIRAIDPQDISQGIVCTLEDITERKQAEKELAERMEELERFTRLTVDRELKMIYLKEEINTLLEQLGREKKYKIVE